LNFFFQGYSHLVISVKGGISYSPLYFHDGGIQDFFRALSSCATLNKNKHQTDSFTPGSHVEPLAKSLHSLKFDSYYENVYKRDLSWQLMEWGAKVTQTARNLFKNENPEGSSPKIEPNVDKKESDEDWVEIIGDFDASEDLVSSTTIDDKQIDWYSFLKC
jgi:hypothetical protein